MSAKKNSTHLMEQRRSIRRYRPEAISRGVIARLLAAATKAPSAHNRQPWRFAVLDESGTKEKLASAMGRRLRADRAADGDDPQAIEADVARSHARITEAPAVVVICIEMTEMDRYPDELRRQAEYLMAVQSTAMAVQNLLLASEAENLGACVMCAPLFCPETVSDALNLPRGWQAQMLVTIGNPADRGKTRPRKTLKEVALWLPEKPK
jgi:coenzyme F420-0:L-glutamate ligase / coenzyme F420-1:gamma-L-glutamate ligase